MLALWKNWCGHFFLIVLRIHSQVVRATDGAHVRWHGDGMSQTSGVCASPTTQLLYIADSANHRVLAVAP